MKKPYYLSSLLLAGAIFSCKTSDESSVLGGDQATIVNSFGNDLKYKCDGESKVYTVPKGAELKFVCPAKDVFIEERRFNVANVKSDGKKWGVLEDPFYGLSQPVAGAFEENVKAHAISVCAKYAPIFEDGSCNYVSATKSWCSLTSCIIDVIVKGRRMDTYLGKKVDRS